jgi:hypothetical protein
MSSASEAEGGVGAPRRGSRETAQQRGLGSRVADSTYLYRCRPPCSLRERKWLSLTCTTLSPRPVTMSCGSTMLGAGRLALRVLLRASALRLFSRCVVKTCLVCWRSGSPPRSQSQPRRAARTHCHSPARTEAVGHQPSCCLLPPTFRLELAGQTGCGCVARDRRSSWIAVLDDDRPTGRVPLHQQVGTRCCGSRGLAL